MKQDVKITIITVSYNAVQTIEQTIQSVVRQSYKNIEYIIIDGASTDGTLDVIRKYKDKLILVSEPDNGIYDAMNKGIDIATGDYIQFLGADDCLVDENVIAAIVQNLSDGINILSAGILAVDEVLNVEKYMGNLSARDRETFDGKMIPHPGMFVSMDLMKKMKFDVGYKIASDYKFFLKCYFAPNITIKYIDFPVVYFSMDGRSNYDPLVDKETRLIQKEFSIQERKDSWIKLMLKKIIKKSALYLHIWKFVQLKRGWTEHSCHNVICRWCGRNEI